MSGHSDSRRKWSSSLLLYHSIIVIEIERISYSSGGLCEGKFTRSLEAKQLVSHINLIYHSNFQIIRMCRMLLIWCLINRHEKHVAFHQKYREKFSPDESVTHNQLPVYFGNICLRFLPVLDIVIHRFLEVPINSVNKSLESILGHYGCLYKFHGNFRNDSIPISIP